MSSSDQLPTYHLSPSTPRLRLPPAACDAHCHVFGPTRVFPYAKRRAYTPPHEAPKERLFALHDMLGIERCVIVQAGCHGHDNRVVADAIAAKGGRYRGVALLPTDVPDASLRQLDAAGFRGVRFNFMRHLGAGPPPAEVIALAERIAKFGWHLQLHMEPELIAELTPALRGSPVPVVIDHMGRIDASRGLDQPPVKALFSLLEDARFWVKVSGSERCSREEPPYADATPLAARLVATFPERVLWGTDWPHPNFRAAPPDDGQLVDLLEVIAPTALLRQALLVDNPLRLYRFGAREVFHV